MPERAARAETLRASSRSAERSRAPDWSAQLRMIAVRAEGRETRSSRTVWLYCACQESPFGEAFSSRRRPSRRSSLLFVKGTRTRVDPSYETIEARSDGESRVTKSRRPSMTAGRSCGRSRSSSK